MHKLLILTNKDDDYRSLVESANLNDLKIMDEPSPECDIILGSPARIRDILSVLPNLKWVQSSWAGVEPLLGPSLRRDYILTNARGVFGQLMSEYVFAYLLAHERKLAHLADLQKSKKWEWSETGTLRGRIIGLLGVGSIGAEIARTAKFFGMKVLGYTRESESSDSVDQYFHGNSLLEMANQVDYLVNVLPNVKDTQKIINAEFLSALQSHALFINVGRGTAVDENALLATLTQQKIAGAVLDVFEKEPLPKDHPFWTTPNLTITFHTAAPSLPEDIVKLFVKNYHLYAAGKPLKYKVDFEKGY